MPARSALGDQGPAQARSRTTRATPNAAALRRIAPTLARVLYAFEKPRRARLPARGNRDFGGQPRRRFGVDHAAEHAFPQQHRPEAARRIKSPISASAAPPRRKHRDGLPAAL